MESSSNVPKLTHSILALDEVKVILEKPPRDKINEFPPDCPKGGEVYLYSFASTMKKGKKGIYRAT